MPASHAPRAWDDRSLADPHAAGDKRRRVREMFAAIAHVYDLNNRVHSLGQDQRWRRRTVALADLRAGDAVVDVACGTGDLTIAFAEGLRRAAGGAQRPPAVLGIDFTFAMLPRARAKSVRDAAAVRYLNGDAMALPLPDACCDVLSIAFGIRNVQEPQRALREFRRVLRPGGRLLVLEFSEPANPLLRGLNRVYTHRVMPLTATLIARDRSGAYRYLPRSIATFIGRDEMTRRIADAGFVAVTQHAMTFGVCVCYRGVVPE